MRGNLRVNPAVENAGALIGQGLTASDTEVALAVRYAFEELKLVVEPGGAVAAAAVLAGKVEARGRTVGVVLSGGNVDPNLLAEVLANGDGARTAWPM